MKCFGILAAVLFSLTVHAQSFTGSVAYGETTFSYQIKLEKTKDQTKAFYSSIEMNAYEIPCQKTTLQNDSLQFYVISDYYTYAYLYIKHDERFRGNLSIYSNETEQLLNSFETEMVLENRAEPRVTEKQEFTFNSNSLALYGTLWKPKNPNNKGLFFVTSSQGTDRSGTNAEASYFTSLGYTVFNYDKRGTGKSEGNWQSATIEELCSDDMNALEFFSKISTLSLSDIGIKGSSQGGIKVPYILSKMPDVGFGISISCPSGTLMESDLNHWKNANYNQIGKANINQALKVQKAGYDYLAGNISYKALLDTKNEYGSEDWLKHIWIPERDVQKDYKLNFSGLPYFEKITQPVLLIQGLADDIIPEDSYKIIENALKKSESKKYEILTFVNTTHSMNYLDKEFPYFQILTPDYLIEMTKWLEKLKAK